MLSARRVLTVNQLVRILLALIGVAVVSAVGAGSAFAAAPGTLDSSFGSGGLAGTGQDTRLFAAAVQGDGKVVVAGESGVSSTPNILVARFTAQGGLDPSFGSGGIVHGPPVGSGPAAVARGVAIQPDGKIVVVGTESDSSGNFPHALVVERYTSSGGLDASFGSGGKVEQLTGSSAGQGLAVAVQPDGKIVATGAATASGSDGFAARVAVLRLTSSGALDSSFAGGGTDVIDLGPLSYARAVALQSDGKIVIAGSQAPGLQVPNALIARLTSGGQLDSSFGSGGSFAHQYAPGAANSSFNALAIQPDGKIIAAGSATSGNTGADRFRGPLHLRWAAGWLLWDGRRRVHALGEQLHSGSHDSRRHGRSAERKRHHRRRQLRQRRYGVRHRLGVHEQRRS